MDCFVIIPSRYGSTRFEGKSLALIKGTPMIEWVYRRVEQADHIANVVVATDDKRIVSAVSGFGGQAILTGSDARSGTDRVAEAVETMGLRPEDIVVNVQGDQPLIHPECIDEVIRPFLDEPDVQMTTLAYRIQNEAEITNPKDVKVTFDRKGFALYFSRSPIPLARDRETVFDTYKHLGVYAYTRWFLETFRNLPEGRLEHIEKLEQLRVLEHGYPLRVVISAHDSPEVDLPEDITRVETIIKDGRIPKPV
ncbi:3-deoxy-manno-octulosonate cytidylyltransferase (EC [Olavius algarvensis associated proteobacterium Delta 3]|nr:3-deoxy-manno-octulosonate cytidylyltransferase (EC [Olavius algarvensis associated proteobacterium Delta 3]CAB5103551.1 3-deoxy-manno-octulosonate cytidylyltransferase (EC [Olavius algarvensis associated proteobacterium Delta 3]